MRAILVLSIALFMSPTLLSQNKTEIDSLLTVYEKQAEDTSKVRTLNAIVKYYMYRDGATAKEYATRELALATKLNDIKGRSAAHYQFGSIYLSLSKEDSCRYHYETALDFGRETGEHVLISQAMNGLGTLEFNLGNYDAAALINNENRVLNEAAGDTMGIALNYEFDARVNQNKGFYTIALDKLVIANELYEQLGAEIRQGDAMKLMGTLEMNFGDLDNAIKYIEEALVIYQKHEDVLYEAEVLNDLGSVYLMKEAYDTASDYLNQSLELCRKLDSKYIAISVLHNLGDIAIIKKEYGAASQYLEESLAMSQEIKSGRKVAISQRRLANLYNKTNRPDKAIEILEPSIAYGIQNNNASVLQNAWLARSNSYKMQGNYQSALVDYRKAAKIQDSLFDVERSRQAEEMRAQFDLERKEDQLALQENEIAMLEQQETISSQQRLLLILGLISVLIASGLGFYSFRQKMKRNKAEKMKVDAELEFKKKELTTHALHLAKKNEVLLSLKEKVENPAGENVNYRDVLNTINFDLKDEQNWKHFTQYFEQVHKDFSKEVQQRYPDITLSELRLMALLKMNLTSKEIASMLNITSDGVKKARQRLRKKMQLTPEDSLEATVMSI